MDKTAATAAEARQAAISAGHQAAFARLVERLVPKASRGRHERHRRHYGEAPRVRPMGQGLELLALRRDGATIPVEISLSPGRLASGQEHVICTVRDITGWKRMRQLSRAMVTAVENERKRLSRDLHDEFLQYLAALKIKVKLLASEPAEEDREQGRAQIAGEIDDTIRGVQRMIRGLLPPQLERRRLSSALESAFRDIGEVHGFTVRASLDVPTTRRKSLHPSPSAPSAGSMHDSTKSARSYRNSPDTISMTTVTW